MNRRAIIHSLLVLVAVESAVLWWAVSSPAKAPVLPAVSLDSLEAETVSGIRSLEAGLAEDNPDDWLRLASTYRAFALLPAAEYCHRRAAELRALTPEEQFARGVTLSRLGQYSEARIQLEGARSRGFNPEECDFLVARDYLRSENPDSAERQLRKIPDSIVAGIWLARLLGHEGEFEAAAQRLAGLLAAAPQELRVHQLAGWVQAGLGNRAQAEQHRQWATYLRDGTPRDDLAQREDAAVRARFGTEKRLAAIAPASPGTPAFLREAFRAKGDHAIALRLAEAQLAAGDSEEAIAVLAEVAELVGPTAEALALMGRAEEALGNGERAVENWKQALELRANRNRMVNVAVLRSLMNQSNARGNQEDAQRSSGLLSFELGLFALEQDDYQNAHQQFLNSHRQLPDHVPSSFYLGEVARLTGNPEAALQAYQNCLRINPNHGRAARALHHLKR